MASIDAIANRRSTRSFIDKEIPPEILISIFEAGLDAPSPKNRQPWQYIVISDSEKKAKFTNQMRDELNELYSAKPDRADILQAFDTLIPIEQCSVLLLVCYKNNTTVIHKDNVNWNISAKDVEALELMAIGASVENMLLRAQTLGVSSLWCGDVLYAYNFLKNYSVFPVVSAICFGYSNDISQKHIRKNRDDFFIF